MTKGANDLSDALGKLLQAPAHQSVIVPANGITSDKGLACLLGIVTRRKVWRQVIHADTDNPHCSRNQLLGASALESMARHIVHVAMETFAQPAQQVWLFGAQIGITEDRKSTRLNSSHVAISYAVFCLKKK